MMLNEFLKEHKQVEEQQATHWRANDHGREAGGNNRAATEDV